MLLRFVDQKIVLAFMNLACSSLQANIQFFKHYIFCTFSSYTPPPPTTGHLPMEPVESYCDSNGHSSTALMQVSKPHITYSW